MLRYAGPFVFLASIPLFYYAIAPAAPIATVGLLLAALIGAEFVSERGQAPTVAAKSFGYRTLLHIYIPLQLIVTLWAIHVASQATALGVASLALSIGVTTGVFGMLAAHEMIHSKSRAERLLGVAMLSGMVYRHFRIAHVHGHHRWAGTERDSATARPEESFYAFFPRTIIGQFMEAYRFECVRNRGRRFGVLANRAVQDVTIAAAL